MFLFRRLKHRLNTAIAHYVCRKHGHFELCSVTVFRGTTPMMESHEHDCARCGDNILFEYKPLSGPVQRLLADMGMSIEDQQATYIH